MTRASRRARSRSSRPPGSTDRSGSGPNSLPALSRVHAGRRSWVPPPRSGRVDGAYGGVWQVRPTPRECNTVTKSLARTFCYTITKRDGQRPPERSHVRSRASSSLTPDTSMPMWLGSQRLRPPPCFACRPCSGWCSPPWRRGRFGSSSCGRCTDGSSRIRHPPRRRDARL